MTTFIDILVLCKNNPLELMATLDSIAAIQNNALNLSVLVVDGSSGSSCERVITDHSLYPLTRYVSSRKQDVKGIYPSMNLALSLAQSEWCIFMNSGDEFHPSFSVTMLADAARRFPNVSCIFGRSEIVSESGFTWHMPSSRIRNIGKWCRFFEPSHQSMFVRTAIAKAIRFEERSPYGADSHWKRTIINLNPSFYLPVCISRFYLGGTSSTYGLQILFAKLGEPTRRPYEKVMELTKYILYVFGLMSPRLQYLRSELVGSLF